MPKSIKIIIILSLAFAVNAAVAKLRLIPAPEIQEANAEFFSPGDTVNLKGNGFIKDFSKAHKVYIKKQGSKKRIKLKSLASDQASLELALAQDIDYGDYDFYIYLRTRFFKSKKRKLKQFIKVRPKAPEALELKFKVIEDINSLDQLLDSSELAIEIEDKLKPGLNSVRAFYYEDGFRSLPSESINIFYLPKEEFENKLAIESERPLTSFARQMDSLEKIDVSTITHKKEQELTKSYYLTTPTSQEYLKTSIQLSPLFIKEAHVKNPEHIVISNRSSKLFDLTECEIADSIKTRYVFKDNDILAIEAKTELKIEANLGLNDTGDEIKLSCAGTEIENINYSKLSLDGFAIFE